MQLLKDIFYLFFPNSCVTCNKALLQNELILCIQCRHKLPIISYNDYTNNKVVTSFYGRVPINKAVSFFYYQKQGITQRLIQELKYKNNQKIGAFIGNWLGHQLKESNEFNNIDYIIPVPLHPKKLKKRGYNQLTLFGESLSKILNITYKPNLLIKKSMTHTQTLKHRLNRFSNTSTSFSLNTPTVLANKHILLIDDVITTGATIEACCNELLKVPNITISIATMAYTEMY
ncbi:ComF family protein [Tenacibaculum maritimum]|uniref:ComF family protein n=1 Tax=Tenacibaculum maritimum TaxID=107401 RepID=UPI003876D747